MILAQAACSLALDVPLDDSLKRRSPRQYGPEVGIWEARMTDE